MVQVLSKLIEDASRCVCGSPGRISQLIMRTNVFANYVNYNGIGKYIIKHIYYAKSNEVAKTVGQKNLKKLKKNFQKMLDTILRM